MAFLGGAGSGPFSRARENIPHAHATATHQRFETTDTAAPLETDYDADAIVAQHRLILDRRFLRVHRIVSIDPR